MTTLSGRNILKALKTERNVFPFIVHILRIRGFNTFIKCNRMHNNGAREMH